MDGFPPPGPSPQALSLYIAPEKGVSFQGMKPHDRLTIFRNLHRAGELRTFRELVERYFVCAERDVNDVPADWEGALAARARINQMLPRIIPIVNAAGVSGLPGGIPTTDPGYAVGRGEVLHQIFSARYGDGGEQEIYDFLDMVLGVYEGGRYAAMIRTINPLYYAGSLLGFVARAPKRLLLTMGLWPQRRAPRLGSADLARLEEVALKFRDAEELIDARFAALQDRQSLRHAEMSRQLAELAERLDFAERVLAQKRQPRQLEAPEEGQIRTPV